MPGKIQIKYELALKDYKYAEEQRRFYKKRVESQKDSVQDIEAKVAKNEKDLKSANTAYRKAGDAWIADKSNATKEAAYKTAQIKVQELQRQKGALSTGLNAAKNALSGYNSVLTKLTEITNKTSSEVLKSDNKGSTNGENTSGGPTTIKKYFYNAPAAKSIYFTSSAIQTKLTKSEKNLPSAMVNALSDAFKTPNGNRGVIQMYSQTAANLKKRFKDNSYATKDTNPYGFRFHYNPTSISITYGSMDKMSPELMRDEMQVFNPVTPINVGGVSFELYLNRIDDLSFINPNGTLSVNATSSVSSVEPKKGTVSLVSTDVYPEQVDASELKQIYRKGTMYDLEYLFRAMHSGQQDYNSILRGKTSDIGWIARVPVEVHLGDGLRYLISMNSISVNHVLFNERMVPMLTIVTISGSRFFDMPNPSNGKNGKGAATD
jgi:hypothetical protein